jgi:serine/threonine protein kinase
LKYPCIAGNDESIQTEAQFLKVIGSHPRIIASGGITDDGLVLQRAPNGSLNDYIATQPGIAIARKLLWCKQAAEAVKFIHGKHIIHCDINLRNLLLDQNLDLLLADFRGILKSIDGSVILDGFSRECSKSYMRRPRGDYAYVTTDIFALGSAIYFIMMGHEVFQLSRFQNEIFPNDNHTCYGIAGKCWRQQYQSASEVVSDFSKIHASQRATE